MDSMISPAIGAARVDETDAIAAYVRAHPLGTPFHLPAWSDAVAAGTGQHGHVLVARAGGAIVGILPLTEMRHWLFGRAMVSSAFAVDGGAIADDPAVAEALIAEGWRLAEAGRCPSVELRGGALPDDPAWTRVEGKHSGFVRPLAADDEAELKAIPRKQRAEVRKALGSAMTVSTGGEQEARDHYAVYATSVHNLGTPVFPRRLFDEVRRRFGANCDILTVRHEGRAVASVLSLYHNGTVMPYWGGGLAEARTLRANELMYFALMRHARERGCTTFDFGRSKVGSGAFAYKKNWGFSAEPLAYSVRAADGAGPREIDPTSPRYQARIEAWKKLPLWLANRLGPPLARGLG
jgi:FemAB-related protein (PEP-CTERM system-associated)